MFLGRAAGNVVPPSSMGMRPITGAVAGEGGRPMTAVRAAGFTSQPGRGKFAKGFPWL